MILGTEAAVMASFDFLTCNPDIDMDEEEADGEEELYDIANTETKQNKV